MDELHQADYLQAGDSDEKIANDGTHWVNDLYYVRMIEMGPFTVLTIKPHRDGPPEALHDWRNFQRMKNQLCGPESEAIELYPAESRLVDTANQFYLVVLPEGIRLPFGFVSREVSEDLPTKRNTQRPFPGDARPEMCRADDQEWKTGPVFAFRDGKPVAVAADGVFEMGTSK